MISDDTVELDRYELDFNKKFRARRLAAAAKGQPFLSYKRARAQLGDAMVLVRQAGGIADLNAFWDHVFRLPDDGSGCCVSGRWYKAIEKEKAAARLGQQAEGRARERMMARKEPPPADEEDAWARYEGQARVR